MKIINYYKILIQLLRDFKGLVRNLFLIIIATNNYFYLV